MITSKYVKGLGSIIFCLAFVVMVSGFAAAASPVNTTNIIMNQSSNHTTIELNTITSNVNNNKSKSIIRHIKHLQTIRRYIRTE